MTEFISIVGTDDRVSTLGWDQDHLPHTLQVIGVLPHASTFMPETIKDAERLRDYAEAVIELLETEQSNAVAFCKKEG